MNTYIEKIYVYHNYVKKHFEIDITPPEGKEFVNIIFTGKNGSGKTTLLKAIYNELFLVSENYSPFNLYFDLLKSHSLDESNKVIQEIEHVSPKVEVYLLTEQFERELLTIYIPATRLKTLKQANRNDKVNLSEILKNNIDKNLKLKQLINSIKVNNNTIQQLNDNILSNTNELEKLEKEISTYDLKNHTQKTKANLNILRKRIESLKNAISKDKNLISKNQKTIQKKSEELNNFDLIFSISENFPQYLVGIKEKQAYAIADNEKSEAKLYGDFFEKLQNLFRNLYEDDKLQLKHTFKESKFYFIFSDGRKADFNEIADGFKSILILIAEILLQKQAYIDTNDLKEEPSGIVLIDEPEMHLHLSLQEKILPALTQFFPKLQFVIATHSPQICASDDNSYVYDLSSDTLVKEYLGGYSYDVLSKSHFGLGSEYSLKVTKLLNEAKDLMNKEKLSKKDAKSLDELSTTLSEISPELAYELLLFTEKMVVNG